MCQPILGLDSSIPPYLVFFPIPNSSLLIPNFQLWLSLFKADTAEELEKIKAMEVKEMNEAISAYQRITVSPEFRELERARSLARHDEATALYYAEQKGRTEEKLEVARKMKNAGRPLNEIAEFTGLPAASIERM